MSLLNPEVSSIVTPFGFEEVINSYQSDFATLDWNKKSFGRAYEQPDQNGEKRIPKVYKSKGDYVDMLPNDHLEAFSFLMARSSERYVPDDAVSRDVSAVFWFDLNAVRPGVDKPSVASLIYEAQQLILDNAYTLNPPGIVAVYDERIEDIFFGYIERDMIKSNKYLMFPFAGFRIDFIVGYPNPCD